MYTQLSRIFTLKLVRSGVLYYPINSVNRVRRRRIVAGTWWALSYRHRWCVHVEASERRPAAKFVRSILITIKSRYYNAQSTDQSINTMLNICTSHEANTNSPRAHTGLTPVGGTLPSHKTSCLYTQSAKLQFIYQFSGHKYTYTNSNVVQRTPTDRLRLH